MSDVRAVLRSKGHRSRSRRDQRAGAITISVGLHIGLFILAFNAASGTFVSAGGSDGGPTGPVFTVTMVRLSPSTTSAQATAEAPRPLLAKMRTADDGIVTPIDPARRTSPLAQLIDRIQTERTSAPAPPAPQRMPIGDNQGSRSPAPTPPVKSPSDHPAAAEGDSGERAGSASTGSLWGAIEPCWRNLGAHGRVPVVLEVRLNRLGDLREPPRVVRSSTAILSEARLQSEAGALAALAACVPRGDVRFGGKTYHLEFPATP